MQNNPMYNAILKWSIAHTDNTRATEVKELDPEKKQFLEKVMDEMMENETATMSELVQKMKGPEGTEDEVEGKEYAIEQLCDRAVCHTRTHARTHTCMHTHAA
jgi:hypothetical protein